MVTERTVGIATGMAATSSTKANSNVSSTGSRRKSATTTINSTRADRKHDQVVADLEHGTLEMADGSGPLNQLRRFAEVRVRAGRVHHGVRLTSTHDRTGKHCFAGFACGGQRLAGQRRLIDFDRISRQQTRVGRHDVAHSHPNDVTRNECDAFGSAHLPSRRTRALTANFDLSAAMALPA